MRVSILEEHGYPSAMLGLSLSYDQSPGKMPEVAKRLCFKGDGHNKFLEAIIVWLDINAPRYWWQQCSPYRHTTVQSASTMHTITSKELTQSSFEHPIPQEHLAHLNMLIEAADWEAVKRDLPESFLQRRIVCLSYSSLQRIIRQRMSHKLVEWEKFILAVLEQAKYPEFLIEETNDEIV